MNDAFAVGDFQSAADLQDYLCRFFRRQLSPFAQHRAKILAFQILHGDELETVGLSQVKNANDIAVGYLTSQDQFLLEALQNFGIGGEFGANDLKGDQTIEFRIARFIHSAHSALPQKRQDFITVAEDSAGRKFSVGYRWRGRTGVGDRPAFRG